MALGQLLRMAFGTPNGSNGGQLFSEPLAWSMNQHQEAYMPTNGMFQRDAAMQSPMVESPVVEMSATYEPKGRNQTP